MLNGVRKPTQLWARVEGETVINLLFVDDDESVLELGQLFIEKAGDFSVETARSAREAIGKMAENEFDVVVSDYKMDDIDGIQFLKTLRNQGNDIPFIILTGKGREDVAADALNYGADFYVEKTSDTVPMFRELANLVNQSVIRRNAEKRAKDTERIFSLLADNTADLIYRIALKPDLRITYINAAAERMSGYTPQEYYADPTITYRVVHPDDLAKTEEAFAHPERFKDPFVMRWVHKNGKVYWSEDLFIPVRDRKGDIVEIIGIARDITERVEAEAALREANRKLNLLSSVIRHDIMNRITGIYVWIDMSRKSQDPAKIREYVDKIDEAGAAIKQILDFSAKYSGLGMKGREWVDLQEIASRNHFGMPMSGIGLNVELEGLRVLADPMLGMVFRNLIENSVRHGGNVTRIWVHWHKEDKGARIVIEDDGTGVPVEDKSRIFERGIGRGTGYGLFFAREILSISGMKITETGETGKGARFEIAVPEGGFRTEK